MQLHITGHRVDITPALRQFINDKVERLKRHFDRITSISVTCDIEKLDQIVEATIHVAGAELHAKSVAEDMYAAIDLLIDKLDRQLIKHKEKRNDHRE